MTARVYVASSWRNGQQPAIVKLLRLHGHEVYDFRNPAIGDHGFHWSSIETGWQDWTLEEYRRQLETHPMAADGYGKDKAALDWATHGLLVMPCGRSAHLEAGYLIGQRKPTAILLSEDQFEPELMYLLAGLRALSMTEMLDWLRP